MSIVIDPDIGLPICTESDLYAFLLMKRSSQPIGSDVVTESQRLDRWYYAVARFGYDASLDDSNKPGLQRYAAFRSKQTRKALFAMIGDGT